ncbi:hypothetical protein ACIBF6_08050, partial [Streptosporangium amethystogenes]
MAVAQASRSRAHTARKPTTPAASTTHTPSGRKQDNPSLKLNLPMMTVQFRPPHVHMPHVSRQEAGQAVDAARSFLPPPERIVYYGGLGALAVAGLIEWPVAAAIGVGTMIAQRARGRGRAMVSAPRTPAPTARAAGTTKPTARAAGTTTRAAKPTSRAAGTTTRAAKPTSRAAKPAARATRPATRAAGTTTRPTSTTTRTTKPTARAAGTTTRAAKPTARAAGTTTRAAKPTSRAAKPAARATRAAARAAGTTTRATKPAARAARPAARAAG